MLWDSLNARANSLLTEHFSPLPPFFLPVANNFLEWMVQCGERSVSYTLLRDSYEWVALPEHELLMWVSFTYILRICICIFALKFNRQNIGHGLVSFALLDRIRNRGRPSRVSRSTNNGPWTREERRVRVNYSARVITVANKSFITLLLRVWIWGGNPPRNEINLSRSIARYTE